MPLQLVIHAPDEASLARARSNARNLLAAAPNAQCEIVVNAEAVPAAIDQRDPLTDGLLVLCGNTMRNKGLKAPADLMTVPAAVLHLAERHAAGWQYIRA